MKLPPDIAQHCFAFVEHAPDPIAMVEGVEHRVRSVNPAFGRLVNRPAEELIGRPLRDFLPEKDGCLSLLNRVRHTLQPESHTEPESLEPHPVYWSYSAWPIVAANELVAVMIQITETASTHESRLSMNEGLMKALMAQHVQIESAVITKNLQLKEIAERKQAEAALRESEERFRIATLVVSSIVWTNNPEGQMVGEQPGWADFTGQTFEEYQGYGWAKAVHPEDAQPTITAWNEAVAEKKTFEFEHRLLRCDGQWRLCSIRAVPLLSDDGIIREWVGVHTDITERKQWEKALAQANELLGNEAKQLEKLVAERTAKLTETIEDLEAFSYGITHDLRAPLRAMQNFSTMLQEDYSTKLDDAGKDYLRRIAVSANRMDKLIQDVLVYSRVLRSDLNLAPVDVEKLVHGILESYPDFHNLKADVTIEGPLPKVMGNEAGLTQCISNLLNNAVKFVSPGTKPKVRISGERHGKKVRIWVADNGIGIDPEYSTRIFGMFQRLSTNYEGTGIGLTIVRKAAERMGGAAGVESVPGQGSRFWLELKAAEPPNH